MKNKIFILFVAGLIISFTACVDKIDFGNSFLGKAPGGSVTEDTIFNKAKYTREFLTSIYGLQYYGLPYSHSYSVPYPTNLYEGKFDCLSDCWHNHWSGCSTTTEYYSGTHTSQGLQGSDKFDFLYSNVWEAVRYAWLLIENVDKVPDMGKSEKEELKAEAKCLIASRYFDTFRHYGGLPIVTGSFSGTSSNYDLPRGTVEATVDFMTNLLNEAIPRLPWAYTGTAASDSTGHWTKAGAMGMKCRIYLFAASPLFNATEPYCQSDHPGDKAANDKLVWYGAYKPELWDSCLVACQDFFKTLSENGYYQLVQANGTRPSDYRAAYRKAYFDESSPEILHSTRVMTTDAFKSSYYVWHSWNDNGRLSYSPTQEYVEMFPWADGTPFDWNKTEQEGQLDEMFTKGTVAAGITLTRDPRLYESCIVNGMQKSLDMNSGNMSGTSYEMWEGGTDAGAGPATETGQYASGYAQNKYYLGQDALRQYCQWSYLRLSEIYLTYAEALLQAKSDFPDAIKQVDIVRARVGLKGLVECNPNENLTSDKDALLNEILRERVCELGMEDCRFFDLIRYKMKDRFETPLHGLHIFRIENGQRVTTPWYNGDRTQGVSQPTHFEYEKFQLANTTRYWWTYGFDSKWYLSPFPRTEVNKGYGLIQNPGW